MNTNNEAINVMVKSISDYIKERIKKARFDVTIQGKITKTLTDNKYEVRIRGEINVIPCCTEQVFNVGDNVLVLITQNDYSKKYIIGKAV